ncbi:hypothetical protein B0J15DRAFT_518075 [Fusarium solani]|uniref:Uncharacterized protein n=1 Tax=Fusarium solani TaxID=169388 RepID=A0A9P9G439_FUSSL|nr:uncharacterized protein B0J15DRAFT_518075 [Fusarium solani]KAH7230857.1 hypothetical protein B0J15DRAFT_518075 [Fusarium solani]
MSHVAVQTCCAFVTVREYLFEMTSFPVAWTPRQTASHVTLDEPTQKRTRRIKAEPCVESSKPTLVTSCRRQLVMDKAEMRHSESFKLRERRRHIWETIEDCESSVVINQRHIVGLNSGDREHFLRRLENVDQKLHKTNDEVKRIQNNLDLNREKMDGLLQEHADLLVQLARVETIRHDRVIPR